MSNLDQQIQEVQENLQQLRRQKRSQQAAQDRAVIRASMTSEELKSDADLDQAYSNVFLSVDGQWVLADLEQKRPVVADMIKERIDRAAKGSSDVRNQKPEIGTTN